MAEPALDLFGYSQKRTTRGEPRRSSDVHVACNRCGKHHWRREHQMKAREGQRFCSRECRYAVSAKVTITCATCGSQRIKFRSQANRGSETFCSAACRNIHKLETVECAWPGCDNSMACRVHHGVARDGSDQYKVELSRLGYSTKYPFCPHHQSIMAEYLGPKCRFTGGRSRMLADPGHEYDHRVLNSRFTKMILFEQANRRCEGCSIELDWTAPSKVWEMDHRVPIFRGGKTKLSNMQILCSACHKAKSAGEKSEAAKLRWHSVRERGTRWMTHYEKDQLIAGLRQKVADLENRLST